ncbi:e3 ubiquitin ligase ari7 [Fusarium beomiforme]|uniref:RBR-type E3 ubiquitin transferase n=1 Tax=Fusarium beomiforme TaxID=44412 RepID=A0A9P5A8V2_9HYPO|nr:e3 ubiquitin ligase ari7 [Fusarium beomiforme]
MSSKLRRSFSEVFRSKKATRTSVDLAPVPEFAGYEAQEQHPPHRVSNTFDDEALFGSSAHQEAQFETHLQDAMVESLRDRIRTLDQQQTQQNLKVSRLEQQLQAKCQELQDMRHLLDRDRGRCHQLNQTVANMGQEKGRLEREHAQQLEKQEAGIKQEKLLLKDYCNQLKEYQVSYVRMSEAHGKLQQRVDELEDENRFLLQPTDDAPATTQQERLLLNKQVHALETQLAHEKVERDNGRLALFEMHQRKSAVDAENKDMAEKLALQVQEIEDIRQALDQQMALIEEQRQMHKDQIEESSRVPWSNPTPRMILLNKMFSQGFQNAETPDAPNAAQFLQTCSPALLTNNLLDVKLDNQQARCLAENLSTADLKILPCDLCQLPKFANKSNNPRLRVNEFASVSQPTACCSKFICTEYDRILIFRSALAKVRPRPSVEGLKIAARMHNQLAVVGRMCSLFDPAFNNTEPDEAGRIPPFNPGNIKMIRVDHQGGSILVPLFIRFIRRKRKAKECTVCTDEFFDVDYASVEEWLDLCAGFHGEWMWKILLFPVKLGMKCNHEIDFCSGCLEQHLKTQLEQYGRNRCDQLACPSDGCGRRLDYDEIRLYAEPETFELYDRYLHLNAISKLDNFRWCLRQGCPNGQLYEGGEEMEPHIQCQECAFEMCFKHMIPWHEGLTCEQFESARDHGDPQYRQTQEWIANNTKPCPNCKENIQKGEACFHMTCSSCHFEFCWICLSDWRQITPRPGVHNPEAHGEGCIFRTNGLTPSQLFGRTVEEALAPRRRR